MVAGNPVCRPARRAAAVALLAVAACAGPRIDLGGSGLPDAARIPGVPAFEQTANHCGPASLAGVLVWAGVQVSPETLAPRVYLPARRGTLPIDLTREARAFGLLAYRIPPKLENLLAEVAAGHPVLVLENRGLGWAPLWHYSLAVGFDRGTEEIVLHAGAAQAEAVRLGTFVRTWARGGSVGFVALPRGELPAADDPEGILGALAELEGGGHPRAAAAGYRAFGDRWPHDWRGPFGQGNALVGAGDPAGAEHAFRETVRRAPERPEPLNNLALLLVETDRADQAQPLARQAVARARALGLDPAPYLDTLDQLTRRPREPHSARQNPQPVISGRPDTARP